MEVCQLYASDNVLNLLVGNESFTIKTHGEALSEDLIQFEGNRGKLWEGGDFVIAEDGVHVFKDQILSSFAKASNYITTSLI